MYGRRSFCGKKEYTHKRDRRSFCEKKKYTKKKPGNALTLNVTTDLEEIERLFLYQKSLHKASHQDYHILLGSITMNNVFL